MPCKLLSRITFAIALFAIRGFFAVGSIGFADERPTDEEGLVMRSELRYRDVSKACTLDLAMPKDRAGGRRPAIVVIHGGGWLEGDKSSFTSAKHKTPGNIVWFAKRGFVALTINYRMSGEAPFPAALDDCRCAIRWLRAHADEYHVDVDKVGAYGNSAGGHLALLLALMPPETPASGEPYADQSSRVQAAASDSGPIDLDYDRKQGALKVVIEKFMGGPPEGDRAAVYRRASPSTYATEKTPPLLLIYGEVDAQVSVHSSDDFVAELGRAGNRDISYIRLAAVDHCPHSLVRIPYLQTVVEDFFVRTLKPPALAR